MEDHAPQTFIGQLIFFRMVENESRDQRLLARIALNLTDVGEDYPVDLFSAIHKISWDQMQALIVLLAVRLNSRMVWPDAYLTQLVEWAR